MGGWKLPRNPDSTVKREIFETIPAEVVKTVDEVAETRKDVPTVATGPGVAIQWQKSGLRESLAWCIFCGLSARAAAKKLNLAVSTTQKYVKTPEFVQFYENHKGQLLNKVNEGAQERFQETLMWAVNEKIRLAKRTRNDHLKNKVLSELIELGLETFKGTRASFSEELTTIWERARKRRDAQGNEVTEKVTIKGPGAPDSARSSEAAWVDAGPSEIRGEDGPYEAPNSALGPGDDS